MTALLLLFALNQPAEPYSLEKSALDMPVAGPVERARLVSMLDGSKKLVVHTTDGKKLTPCFLPAKSSGIGGSVQGGGGGGSFGWKTDSGIPGTAQEQLAYWFVQCIYKTSTGNRSFVSALELEMDSRKKELEKLLQSAADYVEFMEVQSELNIVQRIRYEAVGRALKEMDGRVTSIEGRLNELKPRVAVLTTVVHEQKVRLDKLEVRVENVESAVKEQDRRLDMLEMQVPSKP